MKYIKWAGLGAAVLLAAACFMPWFKLPWNGAVISGVDGAGKYGMPGLWHFVFCFVFIVLTLIPRVWAKQWNVLVAALNLAWMIRNFFALALCSAGECPERQTGSWLILFASVLIILAALFPDIKLPAEKK